MSFTISMEFDEVLVGNKHNGDFFSVEVEVDYNVEDGAIGYVPYGDTQVWHPGCGVMVVDHDVKILSVTNEDGERYTMPAQDWWPPPLVKAVLALVEKEDERLIEHSNPNQR